MRALRLWLARKLVPAGWHVQRDPVRRKAAAVTVPDASVGNGAP